MLSLDATSSHVALWLARICDNRDCSLGYWVQ